MKSQSYCVKVETQKQVRVWFVGDTQAELLAALVEYMNGHPGKPIITRMYLDAEKRQRFVVLPGELNPQDINAYFMSVLLKLE